MPDASNNPLNFWQELKQRKVVRVITVYGAAAFVIIELINNVYEPLRLPEWTPTLVIVLLGIGFIITVILSWIYDITPEGIEKTKPARETVKAVPEKPSSINTWKIATYISAVVIFGLIILNIFGRSSKMEDMVNLDKSIAVRPFWNESTEKENEFFVNGMTEDIRNNLSKIADLRVLSRGSVEKYRDPQHSTADIARDLDETYVLEGTAQRIGNQVKIHVQLILAEIDDHVWDTSYEDMIGAKEVYDLQSRIAQSVANEIKAVITPEEKQLIDKVPTTNLLRTISFKEQERNKYNTGWIMKTEMHWKERKISIIKPWYTIPLSLRHIPDWHGFTTANIFTRPF